MGDMKFKCEANAESAHYAEKVTVKTGTTGSQGLLREVRRVLMAGPASWGEEGSFAKVRGLCGG